MERFVGGSVATMGEGKDMGNWGLGQNLEVDEPGRQKWRIVVGEWHVGSVFG